MASQGQTSKTLTSDVRLLRFRGKGRNALDLVLRDGAVQESLPDKVIQVIWHGGDIERAHDEVLSFQRQLVDDGLHGLQLRAYQLLGLQNKGTSKGMFF